MIRLNVVDDDSILDSAGNRLGGTGAGNGDLAGQTYNVRQFWMVIPLECTPIQNYKMASE